MDTQPLQWRPSNKRSIWVPPITLKRQRKLQLTNNSTMTMIILSKSNVWST